jgi:hypothetical protein
MSPLLLLVFDAALTLTLSLPLTLSLVLKTRGDASGNVWLLYRFSTIGQKTQTTNGGPFFCFLDSMPPAHQGLKCRRHGPKSSKTRRRRRPGGTQVYLRFSEMILSIMDAEKDMPPAAAGKKEWESHSESGPR